MPFPFGKSHKSPADIVKNLKDSMTVLEKHDISDKKAEKVRSFFAYYQLLLSHLCKSGAIKRFLKLQILMTHTIRMCPGHGGGIEEPGGHEGDPVWD